MQVGQAPAATLASYRCRTRSAIQADQMDPSLDGFIQLKAKNAPDAMLRARIVCDPKLIVVEAERLDGMPARTEAGAA